VTIPFRYHFAMPISKIAVAYLLRPGVGDRSDAGLRLASDSGASSRCGTLGRDCRPAAGLAKLDEAGLDFGTDERSGNAKLGSRPWPKLIPSLAGSAGGISPPAAHRTVRKPLDLHGSSQPLPCHLAMTVDAESDRSSRLPGWRPPSLSIRFAPRSLQALRHYYRMIRPRHAHRYFPPSCFALIRFSLGMA
jgi:hypothetical protein